MHTFNRYLACLLVIAALAISAANALAQSPEEAPPATGIADAEQNTAAVRVDGEVLFRLRGVTSYPAPERAAQVRDRILGLARDDTFDPAELTMVKRDGHRVLVARDHDIAKLVEADADMEGVPLDVLAGMVRDRIARAIVHYREDRTPAALRLSAFYLVGLSLLLAVLVWLLGVTKRWLNKVMERRISASIREIERKSRRLVNREHLWRVFDGVLNGSYWLALVIIVFFYIDSVLGVFPWTRGAAKWLLEMVMMPISKLANGFVLALPDLFFLAILFLVVRAILRFIRMIFDAIGRGQIVLANFDSDWSMPTYRLVRLMIIAFSLVIAYPYIPGSESAAFKGVSLFLGVVVSLGSTSFISNMIAGLSMTYRGAYREGDWVRIGDQEGLVEEMRMMVMRLRTRKNECVTIPNSVILNTNVVNYNSIGDTAGILIHPEVGIGYDTPWRLVESMLLEAAARTSGLKNEPAPFVNQKALGDFAITYELNALIEDPAKMPRVTTDLFRNIQDVFHENQVQIMSPAYESDPETPKVVPKDQWHTRPVNRPGPPAATESGEGE